MDDDGAPNGFVTGWDYSNEKFDMKVPERILVVGQDQHVGRDILHVFLIVKNSIDFMHLNFYVKTMQIYIYIIIFGYEK